MLLLLVACSKEEAAVPTLHLTDPFSAPARLKIGSTANQAWLDMETWLETLPRDGSLARILCEMEIEVTEVSTVFHYVFDTGRDRVEIGVRQDGQPTRWFSMHALFLGERRPVLWIYHGQGLGGTGIHESEMDKQPYYTADFPWEESVPPVTVAAIRDLLAATPSGDPVALMVENNAPVSRLVEVLAILESQGAEGFVMDYIWHDPPLAETDD